MASSCSVFETTGPDGAWQGGRAFTMLTTGCDYEVSDVRVSLAAGEDRDLLFPYPAFAQRWRSVQPYSWHDEQHKNVLEFTLMFSYLRSLWNELHLQHLNILYILQSRIEFSVLAKNISSSRELNTAVGSCRLCLEWIGTCLPSGQSLIGNIQMRPRGCILHCHDGEDD